MEPQHFKTNSPMEIPQENFLIKPGVHFLLDQSFDRENKNSPTYFRVKIDGIQGNFLLSEEEIEIHKLNQTITELTPRYKVGDCVKNDAISDSGTVIAPGKWNEAFEDFLFEINYRRKGNKRSLQSFLSPCH